MIDSFKGLMTDLIRSKEKDTILGENSDGRFATSGKNSQRSSGSWNRLGERQKM